MPTLKVGFFCPFFLKKKITKKSLNYKPKPEQLVAPSTILAALPPYKNKVVLLRKSQNTKQLANIIKQAHEEDKTDYDKIYPFFYDGDLWDTCQTLHDFLQKNVKYVEETDDFQTVRTPAGILSTGKTVGVDCKNFSLFSAGIIDAIDRNEEPVNWCYRLAGYDGTTDVEHIFVVVSPGTTQEIWLDATVPVEFDGKLPTPTNYYDMPVRSKKNKMATFRLKGASGSGSGGANPPNFRTGGNVDIQNSPAQVIDISPRKQNKKGIVLGLAAGALILYILAKKKKRYA